MITVFFNQIYDSYFIFVIKYIRFSLLVIDI